MSHASNMAKHARNGAKQMRHAARRIKETAEHEQNGIMHTFQKMGNEAVDAVKDGYEGLRDTAYDYVDQGRAKVESLEHSLERKVKQRPFTSVLMAAGFGFVVGFLFRRR